MPWKPSVNRPASLLLLALCLLAGCSSWRSLPPATAYPAHGPAADWTVRGKLGVRTPGSRDTVHFHWQRRDDDFTLRLSAPIGGQQAVILRHDGLVTAALPDGRVAHADSAGELLTRLYGWQAPVNSLAWWIRGLPDPDYPARQLPADAGSHHWQQDGWTVACSQYRAFGPAVLPSRIELSGPQDTRLSLIIQDWQWPGRDAAPAGGAAP